MGGEGKKGGNGSRGKGGDGGRRETGEKWKREKEGKRGQEAGSGLVSRDVDPSTRDLEPLIGPVWLGRHLGSVGDSMDFCRYGSEPDRVDCSRE